jgi:hypothetical protein
MVLGQVQQQLLVMELQQRLLLMVVVVVVVVPCCPARGLSCLHRAPQLPLEHDHPQQQGVSELQCSEHQLDSQLPRAVMHGQRPACSAAWHHLLHLLLLLLLS